MTLHRSRSLLWHFSIMVSALVNVASCYRIFFGDTEYENDQKYPRSKRYWPIAQFGIVVLCYWKSRVWNMRFGEVATGTFLFLCIRLVQASTSRYSRKV